MTGRHTRHIVLTVLATVILSAPVDAQETQGCGNLLTRLFGPNCVTAVGYYYDEEITPLLTYLKLSLTWSETSAKNDDGEVITTARVIFDSRFASEDNSGRGWVRITSIGLRLLNAVDLELAEYAHALVRNRQVFLAPGGTERVDFQFPLNPGLASDVESITTEMVYEFCDQTGTNCYRPY